MNNAKIKMISGIIISTIISGLLSHFIIWHLIGCISRSKFIYNDDRLALIEMIALVVILLASLLGGMFGYLIMRKRLR